MTSPFVNPPAGNAPQPQTVNMILKSLGAATDVGGGDTPPTQLGHTPAGNAGAYFPTGDDSEQTYTGETAPDRGSWVSANIPLSTQTVRFTYFTARRSEIITKLSTYTGGTAAGATPTLCRVGVYSVDPKSGDLALIAACANDTAMWASTFAVYQKTLDTSWKKQAGTRYALAALCVTAAAAPALHGGGAGSTASVVSDLFFAEPKLSATLTGQSDLPVSVGNSALASTTFRTGFLMMP